MKMRISNNCPCISPSIIFKKSMGILKGKMIDIFTIRSPNPSFRQKFSNHEIKRSLAGAEKIRIL
jgi:hypothetical protein